MTPRKASGKAVNVKDAGRRQISKDGTREGNGNKVTKNTNATRIRAEPDVGIRREVPSIEIINRKGIEKGIAGSTSNTMRSNGANAVKTSNGALSRENVHKEKRKSQNYSSG